MLWDKYDLVILDLDGVVYIGDNPVPYAISVLNKLSKSVQICAATNNAAREPSTVAAHLNNLGLEIGPDRVFTSAQAAASMLREELLPGAEVLAVGGAGVSTALEQAGYLALRASRDHKVNAQTLERVQAVVQGHGPDNSWWDYQLAMAAVSKGIPWIATNHDSTVPLPTGVGPGNGSFVRLISDLTGVSPRFAGKPEPALFLEAIARTGATRGLVIGDRYDTDIEGATRLGLDSLLVLTGVHSKSDMGAYPATYIAEDLRVLLAGLD